MLQQKDFRTQSIMLWYLSKARWLLQLPKFQSVLRCTVCISRNTEIKVVFITLILINNTLDNHQEDSNYLQAGLYNFMCSIHTYNTCIQYTKFIILSNAIEYKMIKLQPKHVVGSSLDNRCYKIHYIRLLCFAGKILQFDTIYINSN